MVYLFSCSDIEMKLSYEETESSSKLRIRRKTENLENVVDICIHHKTQYIYEYSLQL